MELDTYFIRQSTRFQNEEKMYSLNFNREKILRQDILTMQMKMCGNLQINWH